MQPDSSDDHTDTEGAPEGGAHGDSQRITPVEADKDAAPPETESDGVAETSETVERIEGEERSDASDAIEPVVPAEPAWVPKPREPILPQRGVDCWHTHGLRIERAKGRAFHARIESHGATHLVYLSRQNVDRMLELATAPNTESGKLWAYLASVPLEKLMPSRQLEEELKALLLAFASELRG